MKLNIKYKFWDKRSNTRVQHDLLQTDWSSAPPSSQARFPTLQCFAKLYDALWKCCILSIIPIVSSSRLVRFAIGDLTTQYKDILWAFCMNTMYNKNFLSILICHYRDDVVAQSGLLQQPGLSHDIFTIMLNYSWGIRWSLCIGPD